MLQSWKTLPWKRGGRPLDFTGKPDQSLGKCAVLWVSQKKFSTELTLAKFECGEKLERKQGSGRRVVKPPVSARRRLLRQSCDRVGGACEEAGIKVWSDQEFAWSPSLIKYRDKTKFCSCQTLQVLITHFQLKPYSTSSTSRMCQKKPNPPQVPKLRPVENFWGILKGWVCKGC